jgi:hypothetical protein
MLPGEKSPSNSQTLIGYLDCIDSYCVPASGMNRGIVKGKLLHHAVILKPGRIHLDRTGARAYIAAN